MARKPVGNASRKQPGGETVRPSSSPSRPTPGPSRLARRAAARIKASHRRTPRKPHRWRSGTGTVSPLLELCRFQMICRLPTNFVIPIASFLVLVRAITQEYSQEVNRWEFEAFLNLQEASEDFLLDFYGCGMPSEAYSKRVILSEFLHVCSKKNALMRDGPKARMTQEMNQLSMVEDIPGAEVNVDDNGQSHDVEGKLELFSPEEMESVPVESNIGKDYEAIQSTHVEKFVLPQGASAEGEKNPISGSPKHQFSRQCMNVIQDAVTMAADDVVEKPVLPRGTAEDEKSAKSGERSRALVDSEVLELLKTFAEQDTNHGDSDLESMSLVDIAKMRGMTFP